MSQDNLPIFCFDFALFEKRGETNARFEMACSDCPAWDECSDCNITRGSVSPSCEAPLGHTAADEDGVTLETLSIDEGYWRATNQSDKTLTCHNADACTGGQTGAGSFCASGYKGPCKKGKINARAWF